MADDRAGMGGNRGSEMDERRPNPNEEDVIGRSDEAVGRADEDDGEEFVDTDEEDGDEEDLES
jgi:hypothetical protein